MTFLQAGNNRRGIIQTKIVLHSREQRKYQDSPHPESGTCQTSQQPRCLSIVSIMIGSMLLLSCTPFFIAFDSRTFAAIGPLNAFVLLIFPSPEIPMHTHPHPPHCYFMSPVLRDTSRAHINKPVARPFLSFSPPPYLGAAKEQKKEPRIFRAY